MPRRRPWFAIVCLLVTYGLALAAPVVAPYDVDFQQRDLPYAPPMGLHFHHPDDGWQARPFVYPTQPVAGSYDLYEEDRRRPTPLRFGVRDGEGRWRALGVGDGVHLHLLGTDGFGRDLLSRLLHAARISLFLGLAAALASIALGTLIGTAAGYCGGWIDTLAMRCCELLMALPWLYLLLAVRAFLPLDVDGDVALAGTLVLLAGLGWAVPARLIRGAVVGLRQRQFVRAAEGFGASHGALVRHHVLPHIRGLILVQLFLAVPRYVLAEVTLSFLGLGMAEPYASWGTLLADAANLSALTSYSWLLIPAWVLIPIILSYHQMADFHGRGTGHR